MKLVLRLGRAAAAITLLTALASGCAHEPEIADYREARALSDQALDLMNADENEAAIRILSRVVAYNGGEPRDLERRATAYAALNQNDAALRDLNNAALKDPSNWRTHLLRAVTNQKLSRFGDAIQDLDRALELKATDPELVRRRAYLRMLTGNFDGALTDYDQLMRMVPNSGVGAFGRAVALYLAGKFDAAAMEFDRQLRAEPRDGGLALWMVKSSLRSRAPLVWEQFADKAGPQPEWVMIRELLNDSAMDSVTQEVSRLRNPEPGRRTVGACEHALFLGTWASLKGHAANARTSLDSAVEACPADSIERTEARTELARVQRTLN